MSLRLLGVGRDDATRRRSASSRLNSVLGQGLLDHKEELERRLHTRGVPQGDAGLQGIPTPSGGVGANARQAARVARENNRARYFAIAGCALATTLGVAMVIAAAAGAFNVAPTSMVPPPPPSPPPPNAPGMATEFRTTVTTAFELPFSFVFDSVAIQQLVDVVAVIPGVGASGVDVSNRTRDDLVVPQEAGVSFRLRKKRRKLQSSTDSSNTVDVSECEAGNEPGIAQTVSEIDLVVRVYDQATADALQSALASALANMAPLRDANNATGTQCATPVVSVTIIRTVNQPSPPPSPTVLAEFVAFNVSMPMAIAQEDEAMWAFCMQQLVPNVHRDDVR